MRMTKRTVIELEKSDTLEVSYDGVRIYIHAQENEFPDPPHDREYAERHRSELIIQTNDETFVTGTGKIAQDDPVELKDDFETEYPDGASIVII